MQRCECTSSLLDAGGPQVHLGTTSSKLLPENAEQDGKYIFVIAGVHQRVNVLSLGISSLRPSRTAVQPQASSAAGALPEPESLRQVAGGTFVMRRNQCAVMAIQRLRVSCLQ